MKKSIIFDLDGTLWDTTEFLPTIWNRVLCRHDNITFRMNKKTINEVMGKTMSQMGETLFPQLSNQEQSLLMDEIGNEEIIFLEQNGAILYEGVKDTISSLSKEYDLYIVSNSQNGYVQAFLKAHQMTPYFKDIEMSGRTGLPKGENILLLMKKHNIKKAIYVGDTIFDQTASKYAGLPFIFASYGFGKNLKCDIQIDTIRDLPSSIKLIF